MELLVLCPTPRDRRELSALADAQGLSLRCYDYASASLENLTARAPLAESAVPSPEQALEELRVLCARARPDGILSTDDYPGSTLASVLARELGLPGVAPAVNLLCQHKYYSRLAQREHAPEAVPEFHLVDPRQDPGPPMSFPLFLKPVKSFFSVGARRVADPSEWPDALRQASLPDSFFAPFNALLKRHSRLEQGADSLIAETLLEGAQATVEGYVSGGRARVLGVVDSVMFPGTISFSRFEYPSSLPQSAQERMADVARRVMEGLGFDAGLFNIEMIYDAARDRAFIVEINPRMSSQFADLFEKVDGTNTYEIGRDLALGRAPRPLFRRGRHAMAASCVLRTFEDKKVVRLPAPAEVEALRREHPDIRVEVLASEGQRLSQQMQDMGSFRYGLVNIGGRDRRDILDAVERCRSGLGFVLQ